MLIRLSITNDLKRTVIFPEKSARRRHDPSPACHCLVHRINGACSSKIELTNDRGINLANYRVITIYMDIEQLLGLIDSPQGKPASILYWNDFLGSNFVLEWTSRSIESGHICPQGQICPRSHIQPLPKPATVLVRWRHVIHVWRFKEFGGAVRWRKCDDNSPGVKKLIRQEKVIIF